MQILSPAQVLNQKGWGQGWPLFVLTGLPGESAVRSRFKTTGLEDQGWGKRVPGLSLTCRHY